MTPPLEKDIESMLSLSWNNWDDFGVSTLLNAALYHKSEKVIEFGLKIYINGIKETGNYLNTLIDNGWDGLFPLPINSDKWISVATDIEFYDAINTIFNKNETEKILLMLRDAGYLINIKHDANAIELAKEEYFLKSNLREGTSVKSFTDGWKISSDIQSSIRDFTFSLKVNENSYRDINFKFNSTILPYDINILIGENGIGKSHTLKSLTNKWLGIQENKNTDQSNNSINISRLILVSYSPFEDFEVDLSDSQINDKDAYKYFGFRKKIYADDSKINNERLVISRNLPASDSINSYLSAFIDDLSIKKFSNRKNKIESIENVVKEYIDFDCFSVKILEESKTKYLDITNENNHIELNIRNLELISENKHDIDFQEGLHLIKNNSIIHLSSGQRLFLYIVINIIGHIKKDSLIIIDEPELFLHPNLEIGLISLLKETLRSFNSKAILATHSATIAREVPSKCVHVFKKNSHGLNIDNPPFETFGADIQRISSYVFDDKDIVKPFDKWIEDSLEKNKNKETLINLLGDEINEELLIKILNYRGKK